MRKAAPALLLASLLGACATGRDYTPPPSAGIDLPLEYTREPGARLDTAELANWWRQFDDAQLTALVERALAANYDVAQGAARLTQARQALVQARAGRLPEIGGSAGVGRTIRTDSGDSSSFSLGGDAAYEVDLFGGVSRGIEAARADLQASGFDLIAIRTALAAEVATNYIQTRLAQERLAIARDTLVNDDENLEIAGFRVQAGLVSSLDEEQARAQRARTAASIPSIETGYANALNRLAVLTAQPPGASTRALEAAQPIPQAPTDIAAGIPADTLRQRPDVRAAERQLAAQTARIGVAEAELYPALRLTGDLGTSAFSIGGLVDGIVGSLFAGLTQSIFDGGRRRAAVRSQEAAAEGALAAYKQTVLTGLEDVENALVALDSAQTRAREFTIALDAARASAILARSSYRAGLTDFQTLLQTEQSLLGAREGLASARADTALAVVQLYRALGGGWDANANGITT